MKDHNVASSAQPTVASALVFAAKIKLLQLNRAIRDASSGGCRLHDKGVQYASNEVIAESTSALWTETDPSEKKMQLGKAQNLRVALRAIDGIEVAAGQTFSFWKQVGPATIFRGYVDGRELRQGCIIPTVGGGLCQLSNALYDAALKARLEIVERHAHSEVIPGSLAEENRDATIFWNYVDLRFRSEYAFRIEANMTSDALTVRLRGTSVKPKFIQVGSVPVRIASDTVDDDHGPNSCFSCGVQDCFRNIPESQTKIESRTAFLVDEYWPEFDKYIQQSRRDTDLILMPLRGDRVGKQNYAWTTAGFSKVKTAPWQTIARARESRKLAQQGAERQKALLKHQGELARAYALKLKFDVTHLVVTQGLLPYLWSEGILGGRTFDVLMTQLPMQKMHERLNYAHMLHMQSPTLADFRAEDHLVKAETEALRAARKIITPHTEIASIFPSKAELLQWEIPKAPNSLATDASSNGRRSEPSTDGARILFPASTLGRKGAYELREVARQLDCTVVLAGAQLEGESFWDGISIEMADLDDLFANIDAVVLPAFVENRPRRLLKAVTLGIPVIAATACGLENIEAVCSISPGDCDSLLQAIQSVVKRRAVITS